MIHIMMDINEHHDQRVTRGDNNGRDLYLLGVNVLVLLCFFFKKCTPLYWQKSPTNLATFQRKTVEENFLPRLL